LPVAEATALLVGVGLDLRRRVKDSLVTMVIPPRQEEKIGSFKLVIDLINRDQTVQINRHKNGRIVWRTHAVPGKDGVDPVCRGSGGVFV